MPQRSDFIMFSKRLQPFSEFGRTATQPLQVAKESRRKNHGISILDRCPGRYAICAADDERRRGYGAFGRLNATSGALVKLAG